MIQTIDYTSTKEETDSVAEVVNEPLKMIANVSSGTPNILLANDSFRSWVNSDLRRPRTGTRSTITSSPRSLRRGSAREAAATTCYEAILYSQEVVRAAGYSPDIVVVSPSDALAIQLLADELAVTATPSTSRCHRS